jgi:hypothetical protein
MLLPISQLLSAPDEWFLVAVTADQNQQPLIISTPWPLGGRETLGYVHRFSTLHGSVLSGTVNNLGVKSLDKIPDRA